MKLFAQSRDISSLVSIFVAGDYYFQEDVVVVYSDFVLP